MGTDPEPRPGLSSGHIPHSFSLPFTTFLETHTAPPTAGVQPTTYTTLLSSSALYTALQHAVGADNAAAIIAGKRSAVASCGSGMTAGVLWLGLQMLGAKRVGVYDEVRVPCCDRVLFAEQVLAVVDRVCHAEGKRDLQGPDEVAQLSLDAKITSSKSGTSSMN